MATSLPCISGAAKEISSSKRSRIVCSRRAPIFSVRSLTSEAISAISWIASSANSQMNAFGFEQGFVLLDQRILRLGQNPHEIRFTERTQLYANRETALELGNQDRKASPCERRPRR